MKLYEFVKAEDASIYDPQQDKINARQKDDTRKDTLTLKDLNRLKKMRALKKLDALKRQDILSLIYGASAQEGGGGMGF